METKKRGRKPIAHCPISEQEWVDLLMRIKDQKISAHAASKELGVPATTFNSWIAKYCEPEKYGSLPDGFFPGYLDRMKVRGIDELPKLGE